MTDPGPGPDREIVYLDLSGNYQKFYRNECVYCHGDGDCGKGQLSFYLFQVPGGHWILVPHYSYRFGFETGFELTVAEARDWVLACVAKPGDPVHGFLPEGLSPFGRQRHSVRPIPDGGPKEKPPSKLALALALLSLHPDWTNKKIAEHVPCNANWLSQEPVFCDARQTLEETARKKLPRGSKGADGTMEACKQS
jgi:hypothetical protein